MTQSYFEKDKYFSKTEVIPEILGEWIKRDVSLRTEDGKVVFEQSGVISPDSWTDEAVVIAAYLYFARASGENSIPQLIRRISESVSQAGFGKKYFSSAAESIFRADLSFLLANQYAAFSSPVWMNCGQPGSLPSSSCYILSADDHLDGFADAIKTLTRIFRSGGGCGINLSVIRSSYETLSTGIRAPGPVEFMKAYAAISRVIRSGGRERSSSLIIVLDVNHPNIFEFIEAKLSSKDLPDNCIFSVRLTDDFMKAAQMKDSVSWELKSPRDGSVVRRVSAKAILERLASAIATSGEPGIQFADTIEKGNTCAKDGNITASNPCAEFLFLTDCAATLASLNLFKYFRSDTEYDVEAFCRAVDLMITGLDIILGENPYPTESIARATLSYRPILLGYSNLATVLMAMGLRYGSDDSCRLCSAITALMTSEAYLQSARLAVRVGPYPHFEKNRKEMLSVLSNHQSEAIALSKDFPNAERLHLLYRNVVGTTLANWNHALAIGSDHGFRNAQTTAIAPTGTISLVMDCESTGIEPRLSLFEKKHLMGGGTIAIRPNSMKQVLRRLRGPNGKLTYSEHEILEMMNKLTERGSFFRELKPYHREIFGFALGASEEELSLDASAHVRMVRAAAPHVSGGISKTILLPVSVTDTTLIVRDLINEAWAAGIKGVTIYKEGSIPNEPTRVA